MRKSNVRIVADAISRREGGGAVELFLEDLLDSTKL